MTSLPTVEDIILPITFENNQLFLHFTKLLEVHNKKFLCVMIRMDLERAIVSNQMIDKI